MSIFEQLKDIVPWVTILVSIGTFIYANAIGRKVRNQQIIINERIIESGDKEHEASKKADVRIDRQYQGEPEGRIVVTNYGPSAARNIRVEQTDGRNLITQSEYNKLPCKQLLQGDDIFLRYVVTLATGGVHEFKVTWDDDFKEGNELIRPVDILS